MSHEQDDHNAGLFLFRFYGANRFKNVFDVLEKKEIAWQENSEKNSAAPVYVVIADKDSREVTTKASNVFML